MSICQNSYIDRFYVLQSATQLLGYMQNTMVWVEDSGEAVSIKQRTVAASIPSRWTVWFMQTHEYRKSQSHVWP